MLSPSEQDEYLANGYLVKEELFTKEQMNTLKNAALRIVDEFDPRSTRSIFSTKSADTVKDLYFLNSDDKVRCFFEEEAFNDEGELAQNKSLSINKIGHALHALTPEFIAFSQAPIIAQLAKDLGVQSPEIRQSMYIFKQAKIGGEIRWHQDATYFYTHPMSVVTFWIAIEDATLLNGCLQVCKEGANYPLKEQFKRYPDNTTELVKLQNMENDRPWPQNEQAIPLEVKAGSLVVFNGVLPHFSEANRSNKSRHAFTLHITSADAIYHTNNWLQKSATLLK